MAPGAARLSGSHGFGHKSNVPKDAASVARSGCSGPLVLLTIELLVQLVFDLAVS